MRFPSKQVAACTLALLCAHAAGATSPTVSLPPDANSYDIAAQLTANGLPMRIRGFVSPHPPAQVAAWFRRSLGKPLMENTLQNKTVLGRVDGEHYISIQLEPVLGGTRGVLAVSHLKAGYESRASTQAATERLLSHMPSGTRVDSQMASVDGGKTGSYVVLSNTHHEELNRERVAAMLGEDGLALEREAPVENGNTLFFKGRGREAMVVISRRPGGRTTVVLNTISTMEHFK